MTITINRTAGINWARLWHDLCLAGLQPLIANIAYDGQRVDVVLAQTMTPEQQAALVTLITTHDALTLSPEQEAANRLKQIAAEAESRATAIPGWAKWDEATALAWLDTNVMDLASAKAALKAMARMLIALRNKTWPHLQA